MLLRVNGINVSYGELQVLRNVSIEVREREIVSIIGSNAAGKSTLLTTIAGLHKPKSGSIEFLGKRIDGLEPHKIVNMGISLIPEGRWIFPKMTVMDNLRLGAYASEARKCYKDTLERVFNIFPILRERRNQIAETLSGGEQQMLALGRGLMSRPKLLMLDEPSLGLAPKITMQIFDSIEKLNSEGIAILLVEQNAYYALKLAQRAYVLENGRIVLEGASKELMENELVKKAYLGI